MDRGIVNVSSRLERAMAYLDDHVNIEAQDPGLVQAPTLDRVERVAHVLADPQHAQPVLHVTGTNGKGSTAAIMTALLTAHDLSVGTFTSPDLGRVNERIACNGVPISDEDLAEALESIDELERMIGVRLSRFEVLTLAAFRWFAQIAVDVAVVEVGMGGRWDATNIADATVAVITNIGNDHLDILGPTTTQVALEKVGIVKPGSTLVVGELGSELDELVAESALERGVGAIWRAGRDLSCRANTLALGGRLLDLVTPDASYLDVLLPLHGAHQGANALLGLGAVEAFFGRPLDAGLVRQAFAGLRIPGRFEIIGRRPLVVVDGAHNPPGASSAVATLGDFHVEGHVLVVGMNRGRSAREMLEALEVARARVVVVCEPDSQRAMPAAEIAEVVASMGVETVVVPRVGDAVRRAIALARPEEAILVTGSLYLVGEARACTVAEFDGPR